MSSLAPNPIWKPLSELQENGTWWRAKMAREMLTLTNAQGETWDRAGMRDPQNSLEWIEDMAFGWENESDDELSKGKRNFWHWASIRFIAWKRKHGLLSEPSLNDPSLTKSN